jgi:hypothetical protein
MKKRHELGDSTLQNHKNDENETDMTFISETEISLCSDKSDRGFVRCQ